MPVLLDLFCGRWGWGRIFARRGWKVIGVDLTEPPEIPAGCEFVGADVLNLRTCNGKIHLAVFEDDVFCGNWTCEPDAIVASSPCEEFSVHGMKHFHPHPKYPENGLRLFNQTRQLCESIGVPYVMENVRAAQQFVGNAVHHCGPFYLWGNAVPPIMPQGIEKNHVARGMSGGWLSGAQVKKLTASELKVYRDKCEWNKLAPKSKKRIAATARVATIPPELANCVADYFERISEGKQLDTRAARV